MRKFIVLTLAFFYISNLLPFIVKYSFYEDDSYELIANISVTLEPHELISEKHILLSVDHPDVVLKSWSIGAEPVLSYSPTLKEHGMFYDDSFIIGAFIEKKSEGNLKDANLHLTLASSTYPEPEEILIPLTFAQPIIEVAMQDGPAAAAQSVPVTKDSEQSLTEYAAQLVDVSSYKASLNNVLVETESIWLRLLLAFILGLLLSLTPCIYPMIPITVGILQAQGRRSLFYNFLVALCYTIGLSVTFALMGILAASSGQAFGYLMANPLFICCIVAFLAYFAGSLFGFYNLYIPRFMQNKSATPSAFGPFFSAFSFGIVSGSVASPCVSPGLALILTIVATLGSKFLGFLLLFTFGFGISTPLLLVGTFSGSLTMLPRAGEWMVEVQKFFGFMLLGMCIFYMSSIVPLYITMALVAVLSGFMGGYYFYFSTDFAKGFWTKLLKNLIGFIAVIIAVMSGIQAVQAWYHPQQSIAFEAAWYTDYAAALEEAKHEKKLLFIDVWTPYCSVCKAITNKILKVDPVASVLKNSYVVLSVDASDRLKEPYATIYKKFNVQGVPYLAVINPETEFEMIHWQSEMYDMSLEQVRKALVDLSVAA